MPRESHRIQPPVTRPRPRSVQLSGDSDAWRIVWIITLSPQKLDRVHTRQTHKLQCVRWRFHPVRSLNRQHTEHSTNGNHRDSVTWDKGFIVYFSETLSSETTDFRTSNNSPSNRICWTRKRLAHPGSAPQARRPEAGAPVPLAAQQPARTEERSVAHTLPSCPITFQLIDSLTRPASPIIPRYFCAAWRGNDRSGLPLRTGSQKARRSQATVPSSLFAITCEKTFYRNFPRQSPAWAFFARLLQS